MPRGDRTGPAGVGPMTGRGLGPCGGGRALGMSFGRGAGRCLGRGFGWRCAPYAYNPTKEQEIADLKAEKEAIQEELKAIEERLKGLEKEK